MTRPYNSCIIKELNQLLYDFAPEYNQCRCAGRDDARGCFTGVGINEIALKTVSSQNEPQQTVISSASDAKILKILMTCQRSMKLARIQPVSDFNLPFHLLPVERDTLRTSLLAGDVVVPGDGVRHQGDELGFDVSALLAD